MDDQEIIALENDEFLRYLYHELIQKIYAIQSTIRLMLEVDVVGSLNDNQKKYLTLMKRDIEMLRRISDLIKIRLASDK